MLKHLKQLRSFLIQQKLFKLAQQVEELTTYEEPWHEEAVQEFGEEPVSEDEYVKQNIETPIDGENEVVLRILDREQFRSVVAGDRESPYLGGGYFGAVFRGIYQGKPAVAKVILYNSDGIIEHVQMYGPESYKWNWIEQMKSKMSSKLRDYLPEVYLAKKDHIARSFDKDGKPLGSLNYEIIIMEELFRIPNELSQLINGYGQEFQQRITHLLRDEDFIYQLAENLVAKFPKSAFLRGMTSLKQITPQELFTEIYKLGSAILNSDGDMVISAAVGNYIQQKLKLSDRDRDRVQRVVHNVVFSSIKQSSFPRDQDLDPESREFNAFWQNLPETSGLLESLRELHQLGLSWKDIKSDNLMMNRDGHFKIIDLGLYKTWKTAL